MQLDLTLLLIFSTFYVWLGPLRKTPPPASSVPEPLKQVLRKNSRWLKPLSSGLAEWGWKGEDQGSLAFGVLSCPLTIHHPACRVSQECHCPCHQETISASGLPCGLQAGMSVTLALLVEEDSPPC